MPNYLCITDPAYYVIRLIRVLDEMQQVISYLSESLRLIIILKCATIVSLITLHTNNPVHTNNTTEVKDRPGSVTENDKVYRLVSIM